MLLVEMRCPAAGVCEFVIPFDLMRIEDRQGGVSRLSVSV